LPNKADQELLDFLGGSHYSRIHEGFQYLMQQLTFAPDERLFYRNNWQEGLKKTETTDEDAQIQDFFLKMSTFRGKDKDGVYYFDIPKKEPSIRALDKMTMLQWCARGYTATTLNYIDYCCRDDFGLGTSKKRRAGIHYFAARVRHGSRWK
jgi:hypothetical protein